MRHRFLICAIAALPAAPPALAGQSPWHEVQGGSVRIVTEDLVDKDGILRGALQIRLAPGWKTYWMEPGATGIAPELSVEASEGVQQLRVRFPPPVRVVDGYSSWAGYTADVDLALKFQVDRAPRIAVDLFAGLCETICVPVHARLEVAPLSQVDDAAIVEQAFAALPRPADARFGITGITAVEGHLMVEAALPEGGPEPELFLANPEGWELGVPVVLSRSGDAVRFAVPVHRAAMGLPVPAEYTLVAGDGAVAGTAVLPQPLPTEN